MLQRQKFTFWKKTTKVKKHFTTNFHNFALEIETSWATRMVKSILKTRNANYDAS